MNTKADMNTKQLMVLIIGIVIFLIFVMFGTKVYEFMKSKGDVEGCRLSVLAAAQSRFAGESSIDLDCPRKQLVLSEKSYTVNNKEKKYGSKEYTTNIKLVFAQEMAECWKKTGEGYVNVFEESVLKNNNACLICSHIKFLESPNENIETLAEYIKETKIPATESQFEDTTYYNYINKDWKQKAFSDDSIFVHILQALGINYGTKEINTNILLDNEGEIDFTKEYYILLLGVKKGAFEFYNEDTYFIVVGRTETLTDPKMRFCDYLYN